MYFDPTLRQTETKADPFKLGTLIVWLEKQPADGAYCYLSTGECLLAKYFTAHGFKGASLGSSYLRHAERKRPLPTGFDDIASGSPRTYGAALDRARNL